MSWNRPDNDSTVKLENMRKRKSMKMFLLCFSGLVILSLLIFRLLVTDSKKPQEIIEGKTHNLIKPVKPVQNHPASVSTNNVEPAPEPVPYADEHGNLWIAPHRPYRPPNTLTVSYPDRDEPLERIFQRTCDIRIGQLLSITPGDEIEMQVFGKRFRDDFVASVADKIEILPDDDDYTKQIKQSVAEVRKEIIERAKKGEDPAKIMTEAWDELYRLGRFKADLRQQILELSQKGDCAPDDVSLLVDATDQMLANKGLPPFKNKKFLAKMLKVRAAKAHAEPQNMEK